MPAAAVQPTILRWGGTTADWTTYAVDQEEDPTAEQIGAWNAEELAREPLATPRVPEVLSFHAFGNFTAFLNNVGWEMLWDLNALERQADGSWDPTNDLRLLKI